MEANLQDKGSTRGLAIYIRNLLNCSKIDSQKISVGNETPSEVISVELKLKKNEKLILSNIYRSSSSNTQENDKINNFFKSSSKLKYDHQLILGDLNRKDIDWNMVTATSHDDNNFIEAVMDSYLTQHVLTPTRGRGTNEPSLIDLVFSRNAECIESIELHAPLGKSDHSLIKLVYRTEPEELPGKIVCDYVKVDFQKLRKQLDIEWESFLQDCGDDIDLMWEKFINIYGEGERECIPRKITKTGKKKFSHPLDRKSLAKRKKKYRLWKRYINTKDVKIYEEVSKPSTKINKKVRETTRKGYCRKSKI